MPLEGLQLSHYRLVRLIGSGGMGEVYLAEDTRINRQVAIKVMRTEAAPYPDANAINEGSRLFQREMQAITLLDHPHILPLYDFGKEEINKTTLTYMVMPFRQEGSLSDWLQQRDNADILSPQDVAHFISQAADALQHAHNHQLIHRDVKPSNFLIRSRARDSGHPDLLLADFGIAKFADATTTTSQSIRGTPAYMAPEQWDGQPVPATDQYALAMMAYQLLTGYLPFQGGPSQVMRQHFTMQPQPPSTLNPRISPVIDAVILRALEKKAEDRFPSISTFAQAFQAALQGGEARRGTLAWGIARGVDIRATLAISRREAMIGTSRMLTLPGGRRLSVSVPEGTQDGKVIRLEGEGEPSSSGGPPGALILTIAIQRTEAAHPVSDAGSAETTVLASNPRLQAYTSQDNITDSTVPASNSQLPTISRHIPNESVEPTLPAANQGPSEETRPTLYGTDEAYGTSPRRPGFSPSMTILLVGVVFIVIVASVGLFAILRSHQVPKNLVTATATTPASHTGQANSTATTQVNTTATFIAKNPNPYPPNSGTLVLFDPLSDNSQAYNWGEGTDSTGGCQFTNGAYHVSASQGAEVCTDHSLNLSDFVYEVQMTIIQGSCGGIVFRTNLSQGYFLGVCTNGSYKLTRIANPQKSNDVIPSRFSPAINTGLNQTNVIAIVARQSTFTLYVNKQQVDTITDGTYANGLIGVAAIEKHTPTEVAYSNARVWTL
jgi:serine/threonine protein kinase